LAQETPRLQVEGVSRPKDYYECVSAPSEITRVWFYIYPMPQKLLKNYFYFWNSTRQVHHDVVITLRRHSYDITSTCPTISMASLRFCMTLTQQRKSIYHICCIRYFYTTLDTMARSPDSTGQILLFFYEIYRVCDRACSRINFARKGILVCVYAKVILRGYIGSDFANSKFVCWKSLMISIEHDAVFEQSDQSPEPSLA
jgi:hypothetical protein